jgi:hypothetical protein
MMGLGLVYASRKTKCQAGKTKYPAERFMHIYLDELL